MLRQAPATPLMGPGSPAEQPELHAGNTALQLRLCCSCLSCPASESEKGTVSHVAHLPSSTYLQCPECRKQQKEIKRLDDPELESWLQSQQLPQQRVRSACAWGALSLCLGHARVRLPLGLNLSLRRSPWPTVVLRAEGWWPAVTSGRASRSCR